MSNGVSLGPRALFSTLWLGLNVNLYVEILCDVYIIFQESHYIITLDNPIE